MRTDRCNKFRYYRSIIEIFPAIDYIVYKRNNYIFFLKGREKEAYMSFIKTFGSIVPQPKLIEVAKMFGISLTHQERKELSAMLKEMKITSQKVREVL